MTNQSKTSEKVEKRIIFLKNLNDLPVVLNFKENGGVFFEYTPTDEYSNEQIESELNQFISDLVKG